MKCNSYGSGDTSMSANNCSNKLRFLTLVINTADLINESTTVTLGIAHAISAPVAIFTTYFFMGSLLVTAIWQRQGSCFIQSYALMACSALEATLSITVFRELRIYPATIRHAPLVLNAILPMFVMFLLLADLVNVLFLNRTNMTSPRQPHRSSSRSSMDTQTT